MRSKQPKRDWEAAREKIEAEGRCRMWREGCEGPLEAAHVIGRRCDGSYCELGDNPGGKVLFVEPVRVVPLCRRHHRLYDAHEVDLLGFLELDEEAQAVFDAEGFELARRRMSPLSYRDERGVAG